MFETKRLTSIFYLKLEPDACMRSLCSSSVKGRPLSRRGTDHGGQLVGPVRRGLYQHRSQSRLQTVGIPGEWNLGT